MEESLKELAKGDPFQNILSLRSILSRKIGLDWRHITAYRELVDFLAKSQIRLLKAPYGHPLSRSLGPREPSYTVNIDKSLIDVIRDYFSN